MSNLNQLKKYVLEGFVFLIIAGLFSCHSQKEIPIANSCSTRFPIMLVHGVSFRDDFPVIKYWSHIPEILEKNGAKVFLVNTDAMNSHVENAVLLQQKVYEVLDETGAEKINIIAHSKGGIESRYMITKLDMADKVASLTTLATPHRGSYIADTLLIWLNKKKILNRVVSFANGYARFIGDEYPDALLALKNLTIGYMENYNQSVPDKAQVFYQSFGGVVCKNHPQWIVRFQEKILSEKEGQNDCTVSVKSYQWGNFKGIVSGNDSIGVSHFDIIGLKLLNPRNTFDAEGFFVNIVRELKEEGF